MRCRAAVYSEEVNLPRKKREINENVLVFTTLSDTQAIGRREADGFGVIRPAFLN